jgi:hypothetical protein
MFFSDAVYFGRQAFSEKLADSMFKVEKAVTILTLTIRHCFTARYRNCCHTAAAKCTTEIIRIRNFLPRLFLHSIKRTSRG